MNMKLTQQQLNEIIELHQLWVECQPDGKRAIFYGIDLSGLDFQNKNLRNAIFRRSNLTNTNFCGATLYNADFSRSDLSGSDFTKANIRYATLTYTNLTGVNLSYADMYGSNLINADLTNANLHDTDISNTDLRGANLTGTNLIVLQLPIWPVYIHKDTIRVGIQHHTHDEWLNFSDEEIQKMHPQSLDWWKKHKTLIVAGIEYIKASNKYTE